MSNMNLMNATNIAMTTDTFFVVYCDYNDTFRVTRSLGIEASTSDDSLRAIAETLEASALAERLTLSDAFDFLTNHRARLAA